MIAAVGGLGAVTERISAIESRLTALGSSTGMVQRPGAGVNAAGVAAVSAPEASLGLPGGDFAATLGALDAALDMGSPRAVARPSAGLPGAGAMWGMPLSAAAAPMWTGAEGLGATYDTCPDCAAKHAGAGGLPAGTPFVELFAAAGERWGIPPQVLAAVGYVESRFQTDVVSSAGAQGVMQFLPSTAATRGVDPWDPASAIDGAASYLRELQDRFGSLDLALAAYNVGQGTISRAGGILPGSQGERYVGLVRRAMEDFA